MRAGLWVVAMASLAVVGCSKAGGGKTELATVGNERVTDAQVTAELKAAQAEHPDDPKVRKAALERIITRKVLAQAARAEKLPSTPENAMLRTATIESFEAGLELSTVGANVKAPTPAEVAAFIQTHPEMFAQRTGYLIEQLHVDAPPDADLMAALKPTKSLEEVQSVLQGRKITFRRTVEQMDSLKADPRVTAAVAKLAPGEPLIMPEPGGFTVNVVRRSVVQPVVGAEATDVAGKLLLAQRRQKAMEDRIAALKADKVKYANAK